jgi:hypothetical protein
LTWKYCKRLRNHKTKNRKIGKSEKSENRKIGKFGNSENQKFSKIRKFEIGKLKNRKIGKIGKSEIGKLKSEIGKPETEKVNGVKKGQIKITISEK